MMRGGSAEGVNGMEDRKTNLEATLEELATSADVRATGDRLARRLYALGVGVAILVALEIVSIGLVLAG